MPAAIQKDLPEAGVVFDQNNDECGSLDNFAMKGEALLEAGGGPGKQWLWGASLPLFCRRSWISAAAQGKGSGSSG